MTLADTANGPGWMIWVVTIVFIIITAILLSGHGAWLIAGYNTASEEEKKKYDTKKLCRGMGFGFGFITVLLIIGCLFEDHLPAFSAYIFMGLVFADVAIMLIIGNTKCKK